MSAALAAHLWFKVQFLCLNGKTASFAAPVKCKQCIADDLISLGDGKSTHQWRALDTKLEGILKLFHIYVKQRRISRIKINRHIQIFLSVLWSKITNFHCILLPSFSSIISDSLLIGKPFPTRFIFVVRLFFSCYTETKEEFP